jgi:hypothetical protein
MEDALEHGWQKTPRGKVEVAMKPLHDETTVADSDMDPGHNKDGKRKRGPTKMKKKVAADARVVKAWEMAKGETRRKSSLTRKEEKKEIARLAKALKRQAATLAGLDDSPSNGVEVEAERD